jgi:PST family polysaccharide transporter
MFWAYGSYVGGRVLVLVSTAILARLLTPEDFGVVALALIFTAFLDAIADLGISQALVIVPDDQVERRANTAFRFTVGIGAALALLTAALTPLIASFFDRDELLAILPVLGVNFLLRALGMTHYALAQKRLQFRTRTGAELADVVVRGSIGIALAIAGFGAWSLVIAYVVGSLTMTAVLWLLIPWRPKLHAEREGLGSMLRFGGTLTVVNILSAMIAKADSLFVGRLLGANALGLYALGFRLPELIVFNLSVVASQVLFPAFAAVGRDGLGDAYATSLRYMLMIGLPSAAVLAILAEPVILVAFGDQWRGSIEPMQILTLFALLVAVSVPAGTAYKAMGRVDVILKLALPRAAAVITLLWLFADEGLAAAAACQAVVAGVWAVIDFGIASRMLNVSLRRIAVAAWPPVVATVPLAGVLFVADGLLDGPLLTLLVGALAGGIVYFATLWFVARDTVTYLLNTALPGRRAAAAAAEGGTPA